MLSWSSANCEATEKHGLFAVSNTDNYCTLMTVNYIENNKVEKLTQKVEHVNNLNSKDLENLFLAVISKQANEKSKGAGLGFIDMRIKTGNLIEITTTAFSNQLSILTLKTTSIQSQRISE